MAYVPTVITAAVGEGSKGKPAKNDPADVKKIQAVFRRVYGPQAPAFKDGICDAAMKSAIADFQKMWGGMPDSTIDPPPMGSTLKRLDRLANPLALNPIAKGSVKNGGYVISYKTCDGGPMPGAGKGYTVHLCFRDENNSIDVSDRAQTDLLSADNLGEVLKIFEKLNCWATPVQCRVQLKWKGTPISISDPQTLTAPVQPHNGKMLPLDETNNGAKLTYQGDPEAKKFHGRMFAQVAGYDKCVFVWAGQFETDPGSRGFDCITYAGATCGASNSHMAEAGDLADHLGATTVSHATKTKDAKTGKALPLTVELEKADPAYIKEFFAGKPDGHFLMFSTGHVVLVCGGEVHEFKASAPSGYARTAVGTWLEPYKTMKLTVRKLPNKPARAV